MAKTATRRVTIFLNGKEVVGSIQNIKSKFRELHNTLKDTEIGSKKYNKTAAEMKELDGIIKDHNKSIRSTRKAWDKGSVALNKFIGLAAAKISVDALVAVGKELFSLGVNLESVERKAKIVFGESLPLIEKAAEKNAAQMGITNSQYKEFATNIGDVLIPMGFQREEAAKLSTGLVDLSGALSEWTNGEKSAAEVSDILKKALTGEREQLKTLGIVIQEADVKNRLREKGLEKLTGTMLQQAKAAATLELITERSVDAQTAFAEGSDTLIRKQAELGAKFQNIKEELATALIPVFHRLLEIAEPVVTTFAEFISNIVKGKKATGEYSGLINILSTVFGNLFKSIGFVFNIIKSVAGFMLNNFGPAIEFVGAQIIKMYNGVVQATNGLAEFLNIKSPELKEIDIDAFRQSLKDIKKSINESEIEKPIEVPVKPVTKGKAVNAAGNTSVASAVSSKATKKEVDKTIAELERLQKAVDKLEQDFVTSQLEKEGQELQRIRQKYERQIAQAKELERSKNEQVATEATQQLLELEDLKTQELEAKKEEHRIAAEEKRKEFEEMIALELATETELQFLELENKYLALIEQADQFGFDTTDIRNKWRDEENALSNKFTLEKAAANNKANKEELARDKALQAAKEKINQETIGLYKDVAAGLKQIAGDNEALQNGIFIFEKGIAAAEVIINLQKELATIAATNAVLGPAAPAVIATQSTIAKVRAGIRLGTIAATVIQKATQKKEGGWHQVRGRDDNTTYTAKYIGAPASGMLPDHPVVLASEAGGEYFVSNRDLRNPSVANYVGMIDNIVRTRQFAEGGFSGAGALPVDRPGAAAATVPENRELLNAINTLVTVLEGGVYAIIPDETVVALPKKFDELNAASGGVL